MKTNLETIKGGAASLLVLVGMYLVSSGKLSQQDWADITKQITEIGSSLLVAGTVAWQLWKTFKPQLAKSAATIEGVSVHVDPIKAPQSVVEVAKDPAQVDVKLVVPAPAAVQGGDR